MTSEPDPARARFFAIQLARVGGVVLVLLGMLIWEGDLVMDGGAPFVGGPLILLGMAELLLLPKHLARRWRTPVSSEVERPKP